jgi:glycine C-acetyltransferase
MHNLTETPLESPAAADLPVELDTDQFSLPNFYGVGGNDVFAKLNPFWSFMRTVKATKPGQYLYERCRHSANAPRFALKDLTGRWRDYVMMGSNDYLGLSSHPRVIEAGLRALSQYGMGSTGSVLLNGATEAQEALEERLARFKHRPAAIVFPSGYAANVGTLTALLRRGDAVVNDQYNHASIIDGCRLSGAELHTFRHNDLNALNRVLNRCRRATEGILVAVDSVFSMDGDIAPLPAILEVARSHGARVMIDEAHALGVLGPHGGGLEEHFATEDQVDVVLGTLSKSIGCLGGFVAGSAELVNYLRFYARSQVFSAALPPAVVASCMASLDVMQDEPWHRERLWANVRYLANGLRARGFAVDEPHSALIPILVGDDILLRRVSQDVAERGLFVNNVVYPAVPIKSARLRLSVMATHTQEHLDFAVDVLAEIASRYSLPCTTPAGKM